MWLERWNLQIRKEGECLIWTGVVSAQGYPCIGTLMLHRERYKEFVEPIPPKRAVHHICEHKRCLNEKHMKLLTKSEHALLHHPPHARCNRGHILEGTNLYIIPSSGARRCVLCHRRANRKGSQTENKCQEPSNVTG